MREIQVYNTLKGEKEPFVTKEPGKVGMYCCGPTTYNFIHLGNARPLVVFDTIRRYLTYKKYEVTYIQNFTDVDDKIINRAREEKVDPQALANRFIQAYFEDADALNVLRATVHPTVSGHMEEIVTFVQALVDKGAAYVLDGDVYFDVDAHENYGKLSKRKLEDLLDGARVGVDQRKKNPGDFALWKKAKEGEPSWASPWGPGRPGWHIECSAMSHKYLGETFDIHGGGSDLVFPHHENEIAQSEGRFGKPMAKYWIHNGFITVNQEKMSKSLGNFFMLRDILAKYPGQVVRFYLLSVHYRSPLDFDNEKLDVAAKGLERLQTAARLAQEALAKAPVAQGDAGRIESFAQEIQAQKVAFEEAMDDDFNTALAFAALFDMARILNQLVSVWSEAGDEAGSGALEEALELFLALGDILGLKLDSQAATEDPQLFEQVKALMATLEMPVRADSLEEAMAALLKLREDSRREKNYNRADAIRNGLKDLGMQLEDTPQGPRWHRG